MSEVDALAEVLDDRESCEHEGRGWADYAVLLPCHRCIAKAVLASDWLAAYVAAERDRAVREALAPARALVREGGDFEPCDQATWSCPHVECEVAVAVLAALPGDLEGEGA